MKRNSNTRQAGASACLRFVCEGCGTPLILPAGATAIGGPCPKCATWIEAAQFRMTDSPARTLSAKLPESGSSARRRTGSMSSGRGYVHADGHLDHAYGERREVFATLRVLAVSLAVLAVILFITMYLRQWMNE